MCISCVEGAMKTLWRYSPSKAFRLSMTGEEEEHEEMYVICLEKKDGDLSAKKCSTGSQSEGRRKRRPQNEIKCRRRAYQRHGERSWR